MENPENYVDYVDIKKDLPHSYECEAYVLGGILAEIGDNKVAKSTIGYLTAEDFYDPRHKAIMKAMEALDQREEAIDTSTVVEELKRKGLYEAAGGEEYLLKIIDSVPSIYPAMSYINQIYECSLKRNLYKTVDNIKITIEKNQLPFSELVDLADQNITEILRKRQTTEFAQVKSLTAKVLQLIRENSEKDGITGLNTGYPQLNDLTNGLQKGNLIILAARPSVGKSTFALNLAANAANDNKSVAFFSLEMSTEQLIMRLLAQYSGVDLSKIISGKLTDKEHLMLYNASSIIDKLPLYFDYSTTSVVSEIKAKCRKLQQEKGLDLIVIDYLQLLMGSTNQNASSNEQITAISRGLKKMALELEIPVIALSQLSRAIEKREDKRPQLSDLRESGSIEQDADIVMFLHREEEKTDNTQKNLARVKSPKTTLIIDKNRQGKCTSIDYIFKDDICRFDEMTTNSKTGAPAVTIE